MRGKSVTTSDLFKKAKESGKKRESITTRDLPDVLPYQRDEESTKEVNENEKD